MMMIGLVEQKVEQALLDLLVVVEMVEMVEMNMLKMMVRSRASLVMWNLGKMGKMEQKGEMKVLRVEQKGDGLNSHQGRKVMI